jgi:hypothetical protein
MRMSGHGATRRQIMDMRHHLAAFTLAELLISVGVLVLLVLLASQLLNSAATITILGHKQMDADSQTRQLFDRMAVDFAQMVKRSDVDYYLKCSWFASGSPPGPSGVRTLIQSGNDKIAFYSTVPGYYPSDSYQSPISLIAYRVNSQNKLERMGKGLLWNAATPGPSPAPVVFLPIPLASPLPIAEQPPPDATPTPAPTPAWSEVANTGSWSDSEVIGPQVFRFEYYRVGYADLCMPNTKPNSTCDPDAGNANPGSNPAITMLSHCSGRHARRRRRRGGYRSYRFKEQGTGYRRAGRDSRR